MQLLFSLLSSNFLSFSTASTLLLLFSSLFPIYRRLFSNYEKHTFGSEFEKKNNHISMVVLLCFSFLLFFHQLTSHCISCSQSIITRKQGQIPRSLFQHAVFFFYAVHSSQLFLRHGVLSSVLSFYFITLLFPYRNMQLFVTLLNNPICAFSTPLLYFFQYHIFFVHVAINCFQNLELLPMDPFLCKNRAERFVFFTRSALFFLSVLMIYFRFLHLFFHHSLMNSILPQYRAGCLTEAFEIHS